MQYLRQCWAIIYNTIIASLVVCGTLTRFQQTGRAGDLPEKEKIYISVSKLGVCLALGSRRSNLEFFFRILSYTDTQPIDWKTNSIAASQPTLLITIVPYLFRFLHLHTPSTYLTHSQEDP
jgi:hypothetical protein